MNLFYLIIGLGNQDPIFPDLHIIILKGNFLLAIRNLKPVPPNIFHLRAAARSLPVWLLQRQFRRILIPGPGLDLTHGMNIP